MTCDTDQDIELLLERVRVAEQERDWQAQFTIEMAKVSKRKVADLQRLVLAMAERIADQSELLGKRAEGKA